MSNQTSFRNSLAAKLFAQRIDKKKHIETSYEDLAGECLHAAEDFVNKAIAFQDDLDAQQPYSEGCDETCGSRIACDDEGYMSSRPGESFGQFLHRVYSDRDASAAKEEAEKKNDAIRNAATPTAHNIEFTTLKDLFEQLEATLTERGVLKD
jgi:hypothetical protein